MDYILKLIIIFAIVYTMQRYWEPFINSLLKKINKNPKKDLENFPISSNKKIDSKYIEQEIINVFIFNKKTPNEEFLQAKIRKIFVENNIGNNISIQQKILSSAREKYIQIYKLEKKQEKEKLKLKFQNKQKKYGNFTTKRKRNPNSLRDILERIKSIDYINKESSKKEFSQCVYDLEEFYFRKNKLKKQKPEKTENHIKTKQIEKEIIRNIKKLDKSFKENLVNEEKSPKNLIKKSETNFKSIWDDYENVIDIMEKSKK